LVEGGIWLREVFGVGRYLVEGSIYLKIVKMLRYLVEGNLVDEGISI